MGTEIRHKLLTNITLYIMSNVITPTNPVTILNCVTFKNNSAGVDFPFTMLKGKSFSIDYFCPSTESVIQNLGYRTFDSTYGKYNYCDLEFRPSYDRLIIRYPTTTNLFDVYGINGRHTLSVVHDNTNKVTLSISDVSTWETTVSDFTDTNNEQFCIGSYFGKNTPGFKIYGFAFYGASYVPAMTDVDASHENVIGYYNQSSNLFYHEYGTTEQYDYELFTPQQEFIQLFPNAVVQTSSKLRYNDGDVPVEAYRVFKTREALMASKLYQGEIVTIVDDPMYNGIYHIVGNMAKRLGFLY